MSEVEQNLLGSIPTGEKVVDPREGDHPNATLTMAELLDQGNGAALRLTYSGLVDTTGREFMHQERVTIPTSTSEDFIHRIFLALCHDLGIVPRGQKNRILADTEGDQQVVLQAFTSVCGNTVPLRIAADDKTGYMRSRIIRSAKKAA